MYFRPTAKDDIKGYDVWVVNATEVEIDVLTGEYKVTHGKTLINY